MSGRHWNPPIWTNQKCNHNAISETFPGPDWGNVGADMELANNRVDLDHLSGFKDQWMKLAPESSKHRYRKQKDIEKTFPLNKTLEFAYPLLKPNKIHSSVKIRNEKHFITGNRLDVLEVNGENFVIHPEWEDGQQQIVVSKLKQGIYYKKIKHSRNSPFFKLKKNGYIPQEKTVHQIVSKEVNNDRYILLRSKRKAELVCLKEKELKSAKCDIVNEYLTTDVALHDTLPGLWAVACAGGEVLIKNAGNKHSVWQANFQNEETSKFGNYYCKFGRHPQSILVGNESTIWLCDTRQPGDLRKSKKVDKCNAFHTVLDVKDMQKYFSNFKEICLFSKVNNFPYLYVVTRDSVFVVDERHCKMPIISWKHFLHNKPTYINTQKCGDMEFILLANKHEKKVSVITSDWVSDKYDSWCRGISLPKNFQIGQDTENFAHRQDLWFRHKVQERLNSLWTGIGSVVHPTDSNSMLFLFLYSNGDIFSQVLKVSRDEFDLPQCIPAEYDDRGKDVLRKWEEDVVEVSLTESLKYNNNIQYYKYDATSSYQRVVEKNDSSEIEEMLAGLPDAVVDVNSEGDNKNYAIVEAKNNKVNGINKIWDVKEHIWKLKEQSFIKEYNEINKAKKQPLRWLDLLIPNYISDYSVYELADLCLSGDLADNDILSKYITRKMSSFLNIENLKSYDDYLAPKILSQWLGSEAVNSRKNTFYYHTTPFDCTDLISLPSKLQLDHASTSEVPDLDIEELYESSQVSRGVSSMSQSTWQTNKKVKKPLKSKPKKQRVDGF